MKLKKKVKRCLVIGSTLLVAGAGILVYDIYFKPTTTVKKATVLTEIKDYGYTLKSNKNSLYKKEFANLTEILKKSNVDEEEYAKELTKLFVLDFYTLSNKVANTDVGGTDFVHTDAKNNFLEKAEDTIYKYVENNMYGGRKQDLPTVKEVTIDSIEPTTYTINKAVDDKAYKVTASWTYDSENDYQNKATFTFVHEDKKLSLVEMK